MEVSMPDSLINRVHRVRNGNENTRGKLNVSSARYNALKPIVHVTPRAIAAAWPAPEIARLRGRFASQR